jgi:hypothetical protein
MTIDPTNAKLYGAWANFNNQSAHYGDNESATVETLINSNGGGGMDHTDAHIAKKKRSSNPSAPAVVYHATRAYSGTFNADHSGGVYIYDPNGITGYAHGATTQHVYGAELVYHQ